MKKSFKKLGFVSLATSSVLLGSMNATDLETYAALQKSSHVFGNYAEKDKDSKLTSDSPTQQQAQTQAQNTASSDTPTPPTKEEPKHTASSGTPAPSTPPAKKDETSGTPSASGSSVASQLTKDTTMVNNLKSVSVSAMNTTLSGVTTISQQTSTISTLLSENVQKLSNLISNAQGLSDAFSTLASAQNTLKGYLDSSSATIGQLTNGSNAVLNALNQAINEVNMALKNLTPFGASEAVVESATSATGGLTTDLLEALKTNLETQKAAFMNVHKNIQTAVAQAQATYTPSVINTNNYGQMYGVDAMAGYKWFFGKTKRFGFRTYGYYSYNHANLSFVGSKLGIMDGASQVNNFTYGVGFDALYNFYESKDGYNTAGLFLGFGLGGDSFIVQGESYLKSQMQICNNTAGCSASMNTSYFQMPVQFGFRSNFSKHSGIEVGFKLPLFTNQFYKERGVDGSVDVFYKRNFSIYFNYMINF